MKYIKKKRGVQYGIFVLLLLGVYVYFIRTNQHFLSIHSFEECVLAGYPISPTYPEVCIMPGKKFTNKNQQPEAHERKQETQTLAGTSTPYKDTTYTIEGEKVHLENGFFTVIDRMSAASTTIHYYGNELSLDYNNDGTIDTAGILQVSPTGTGIFYYVVIAFKKEDGYTGGNGVYLGDRILPLSIAKEKDGIIITYKDRSLSDPMSKPPYLTMTKFVPLEKLLP
jgi:hypothetical protein